MKEYNEVIKNTLSDYLNIIKISYNKIKLLIEDIKIGNSDPNYVNSIITNINKVNNFYLLNIIKYLDEITKPTQQTEKEEVQKTKNTDIKKLDIEKDLDSEEDSLDSEKDDLELEEDL